MEQGTECRVQCSSPSQLRLYLQSQTQGCNLLLPTEIAAVLLAPGTPTSPLGWSLGIGHLCPTSVSGPISKAIKDVCIRMPCLVVSYKPETKDSGILLGVSLSSSQNPLWPFEFPITKICRHHFLSLFFLKDFFDVGCTKVFTVCYNIIVYVLFCFGLVFVPRHVGY